VIYEMYTTKVPFHRLPGKGSKDNRLYQAIAEGRSFVGERRRDRGYRIPHIVARILEEDASIDIAGLIAGLKSESQ
jgi:hypothetical protein